MENHSPMKLSIPNRCTESFDSFTSTSAGGFCQSCQKEVVDFRDMTDAEILAYFAQNRSKTCGSFRPSQLKNYFPQAEPKRNSLTKIFSAGVLSFSLFTFLPIVKGLAQTPQTITVSPVNQQNKEPIPTGENNPGYTIEGILEVDHGHPLAGATVYLQGTGRGVFTDEEGRFSFPDLRPGNTLTFSYVGYETQTYIVPPVDFQSGTDIKLTKTIVMSFPIMLGEVSVEGPYVSKPTLWQRLGRAFR